MTRIAQFNITIYNQDDADKLSAVHRIIDHYIADHRGTSKFTALHTLLTIAAHSLSEKPTHNEKEKRAEKDATVATERPGTLR